MWDINAGSGWRYMKQTKKSTEFIFICQGKDCRKAGSKALAKELKQFRKQKAHKSLQVVKCKCLDRCKFAPSIVYEQKWYGQVQSKDLAEILK